VWSARVKHRGLFFLYAARAHLRNPIRVVSPTDLRAQRDFRDPPTLWVKRPSGPQFSPLLLLIPSSGIFSLLVFSQPGFNSPFRFRSRSLPKTVANVRQTRSSARSIYVCVMTTKRTNNNDTDSLSVGSSRADSSWDERKYHARPIGRPANVVYRPLLYTLRDGFYDCPRQRFRDRFFVRRHRFPSFRSRVACVADDDDEPRDITGVSERDLRCSVRLKRMQSRYEVVLRLFRL